MKNNMDPMDSNSTPQNEEENENADARTRKPTYHTTDAEYALPNE